MKLRFRRPSLRRDLRPQCWSCFCELILFHLNGESRFWCTDQSDILHADRITLYFHKQGSSVQPVLASPTLSNLLLIVPRRRFSCNLFWLPLFVCFLFVFDFWCVLWPSVGKLLSPLAFRFICCSTLCRLNCFNSFPLWFLGQDLEFDCILIIAFHLHVHCTQRILQQRFSVDRLVMAKAWRYKELFVVKSAVLRIVLSMLSL